MENRRQIRFTWRRACIVMRVIVGALAVLALRDAALTPQKPKGPPRFERTSSRSWPSIVSAAMPPGPSKGRLRSTNSRPIARSSKVATCGGRRSGSCGPGSCLPAKSRSPHPNRKGRSPTGSRRPRSASIPPDPDLGRVTVRRLNRNEYRNTIRDLVGVEYKTDSEFPPDDTGPGFDNIGDVLTMSPLLLEVYIAAAKSIVNQAIPPSSPASLPNGQLTGSSFRPVAAPVLKKAMPRLRKRPTKMKTKTRRKRPATTAATETAVKAT